MISASTRRLNVFKTVVDEGGFNVAAVHLGIAQPSVGAHIKALEAQIGQPLFFRVRGSKPRLTKAGETLYEYAVDALQRSHAAAHMLTALRPDARDITIAVHRDIAASFLPARLATFAAKFPKIRVVTRIGTIDEVIAFVRNRDAAAALFLSFGPIAGLRSEIVAHEPLVVAAAADHPLVKRGTVAADALRRFPFVTGIRSSHYFKLVDAALKEIGIDRFNIAMEVEESNATKEIIRHSTAIACLPRCSIAAELAAKTLVELQPTMPLRPLELRWGYLNSMTTTASKLFSFFAQRAAHS